MKEEKLVMKTMKRLEGEGYIMPTRAFHDGLYRMDVYVALSVKLRGKKVAPYVSVIRLKPKSFVTTGYTTSEVLIPLDEVDALIETLKKVKDNQLKALKIASKIQAKVKVGRIVRGLPPEMREELIKLIKEEY